MNMYSLFILTLENVDLNNNSGCDKFCMCYGAETMRLFVFFPCNLVECVILKNLFMETCRKSNITYLKAIQLMETITLY